jgi:hypothetical protein
MVPRFLFFTGEPAVTLPLLKSHPSWSPVLSAVSFSAASGRLHRKNSEVDDYRGVIYFADVRDKDLERRHLELFVTHAIPCWPNPSDLLRISDRHEALSRCIAAGLVNHAVVQTKYTREAALPFPYVLKVGNEHRGEGKYLIRGAADIPPWEGIATMEPFFLGESIRVLLLGDQAFGVRIHHEDSWIKNAPGARLEAWQPDPSIIAHARKARDLFGLPIAGVDYVVNDRGFHFIELNPFPRLGLSEESTMVARSIFREAMKQIETRVDAHAH